MCTVLLLIVTRFQSLVEVYRRMFTTLDVDVQSELDKYRKYAELIRPLVVETVSYLHSALRQGKDVLVEGANAAMLDIDFGMFAECLTYGDGGNYTRDFDIT